MFLALPITRSSFMSGVLLRFRISTVGMEVGFPFAAQNQMENAVRSSRGSAAGRSPDRSRRASSNGTAGQGHKDTHTDCNCECDKRPMLDLVGEPAQCIVTEFRRIVAHGMRAGMKPIGDAAQHGAMAAPTRSTTSAVLADVRSPTRSSCCSSDRKRRSISRTLGSIAREYPD